MDMPAALDTEVPTQRRRIAPARYRARTSPSYWNQRGPFGGWTAGIVLGALAREAGTASQIRSASLQFIDVLSPGDLVVEVETVRRQRNMELLRATVRQDAQMAVVADAVFGRPRGTWNAAEPPPTMAAPDTLPRDRTLEHLAAFVRQFDYRIASGPPFAGLAQADSTGWIRLQDPVDDDMMALAMLADAWYPPLWATLREPVPVATVTMSLLFGDLRRSAFVAGGGFLAVRHRGTWAGDGYAHERGTLWHADGRLAVQCEQLTAVGRAVAS